MKNKETAFFRNNDFLTFTRHADKRIKERVKEFNKIHKNEIINKSMEELTVTVLKNSIRYHFHKIKYLIYPKKKFKFGNIECAAIDESGTRTILTVFFDLKFDERLKNKKLNKEKTKIDNEGDRNIVV